MESPNREIYLDNNATTPLLPEVQAAMVAAMEQRPGNPSSDHGAGERARELLRVAREAVAGLLHAEPESVLFTSGATEANNLVLRSVWGDEARRVVTSTTEHSSVLETCDALEDAGVEVLRLAVDRDGLTDTGDLEHALKRPTSLVSLHWVNSETGVIQPMDEAARLCRAAGVPLHVDAAQAIGKLPVDLDRTPVDYLSLSGHKFHGPAGAGALIVRSAGRLVPQLTGGDQERGLRAGTENLFGIVGLGVAARLRRERGADAQSHMARLRDCFEQRLRTEVGGVAVNGSVAERVAGTSNVRFEALDGQALVARLDLLGIRCSQSSACTSAKPEPSHVLRAMGLSEEEAYASVRFSFSELNGDRDVDDAVAAMREVSYSLRAFDSARTDSVTQLNGVS